MVMPLSDDNSDRRTTPVVNYVLIALNVLVFVGPQGLGTNDRFTYAFSAVPREIVTGTDEVTPKEKRTTHPVTGRVWRGSGAGEGVHDRPGRARQGGGAALAVVARGENKRSPGRSGGRGSSCCSRLLAGRADDTLTSDGRRRCGRRQSGAGPRAAWPR